MANNPLANFPSISLIDETLKKKNLPSGKEVRTQLTQILAELKKEPNYNQGGQKKEELLQVILGKVAALKGTELVINATGVILHTNLGRAPLPKEFFAPLAEVASGYCNLEFDLANGKRGKRGERLENLIMGLTGAEAALVVNNNAGALVLALSALCKGSSAIISRGELVEIGGGFRIPEVLEASGAKMIEVGTTNKTHLADYEKAMSDEVAVILKVHPSNFVVQGFTHTVSLKDLKHVAATHDKILIKDLGSGLFAKVKAKTSFDEPSIEEALKAGADLVTFSGDKLLGGPQAGIIIGQKKLIEQLKAHPLYRALRLDKFSYFLLEQTLKEYSKGTESNLPVTRMLSETSEQVKKRAENLLEGLEGKKFTLTACKAKPGGGSLPITELDSWGVVIAGDAEKLLKSLREQSPPIIARVHEQGVILDCKTLLPNQIDLVRTLLQQL